MNAKIKFTPITKLATVDKLSYNRNDLSLDVGFTYLESNAPSILNKSLSIREKSFLLQIDNLSFTFEGDDLLLKKIDSYTNESKWQLEKVVLPSNYQIATCNIVSELTDDRKSVEKNVTFTFDKTNSRLKISIEKNNNEFFYKVSPNIIIGLIDGMPSSIYIEKLSLI